jgi:hypothetical protein
LATFALSAVEVHPALIVRDGPELSATRATGIALLLLVPSAAANISIDMDTQQDEWDTKDRKYECESWAGHCRELAWV